MIVRVRMLRSWLLGLYIAAQAVGVVPLMYDHTLNVYKTTPVAGHSQLTIDITQPDPVRPHGLIDFHDHQCCAICSLLGPLPPAVSSASAESAAIRVPPAELLALVSCHSARLDRPPKSLPLV
jgi:hypothetical protein